MGLGYSTSFLMFRFLDIVKWGFVVGALCLFFLGGIVYMYGVEVKVRLRLGFDGWPIRDEESYNLGRGAAFSCTSSSGWESLEI